MTVPRRVPSEIGDESLGLVCDLRSKSPVMVVAFAAHPGPRLAQPPYAFLKSLLHQELKAIWVRDHALAWYHRGVRGVGDGVDAVAARLRELSAVADTTVMIGSSAGAYAALLFGALLGCESHAFSPQTFVEPARLRAADDYRFARQMDAIEGHVDPRYADLLPVLARSDAPAHVYFGIENDLDTLHAERIGHLDQVELHRFEFEDHNVAHQLRDDGYLGELLDRVAAGGRA